MQEKETNELENVLGKTHISDYENYVENNKESLLSDSNSFSFYIKDILARKGIRQQDVFLNAEIPERYGYKLLSGEKRTKQRDVILKICYAGGLSLGETQRALRKYGMPQLYAKSERDALLMIAFNERVGNLTELNELLEQHGFNPMKPTGVQE